MKPVAGLACLLVIGGMGLAAQAPAAAPSTNAGAQAQSVVILSLATAARYESDGSGWQQTTAVLQAQTAAAVQTLGVLAFPYVTGYQTVTVAYARVRKPDGTTVVTPPENIRDLPDDVSRVAPVYSDGMVKQVLIKGLEAGDTLEYQVRTQLLKPIVPGQFGFTWDFERSVVTRSEDLTLDVPAGMYVNVLSPEIKPEIEDQADRRVYHWHTSNPSLPSLDAAPEPRAPAVQATTLHDWQQVEAWAAALDSPAAVLTPAVRARAAEILQGVSGDDARIAALYTWVATHIHYVSISIGIGRYQPHPADAVLSNGYGDCKDQATLLVALLRAAGYPADPVLVNAAVPTTDAMPSPDQFNHMIVRVERDGGALWLDTTTGVAPPGWLAPELRGRGGLVIGGTGPARLEAPPDAPPYASRDGYVFKGNLSADGTLNGHVEQTSRGDAEVLFRVGFANVPPARWNDLVQQLVKYEGFGGDVSKTLASAPADTTQAFSFSYDYSRADYSDWKEHYITPPLPPMALPAADHPPASGIKLGTAGYTMDYSANVELAPGYTVSARAPVDLVNDFAEYHATYGSHDQTLTAERRFVIKLSKVPPAETSAYAAFVKALNDDESKWLTVTVPAGALASETPVQQAHDLNDAGYKAYQAGDYKTAGEDLHKAVTLNPGDAYAWNDLGLLDAWLGHAATAMDDYRKAIAADPRQPFAYTNLGYALMRLRRFDEAEKNYRQQLQIVPNDQRSLTGLGSLLLLEAKPAEAVTVLKTAAAAADNANLEFTLGEAEVAAGDQQDGEAAFDKAVQMAPSPLMFNNVAYQLSLHAEELPKARQYAQSAVTSIEGLLAGTELNTVQAAQLGDIVLLADAWDTLGWVYFQQGDVATAESYIAAAWSLGEKAEIADHLGTIYEKQGRRAAAEAVYAQAASPNGPPHAAARLQALAGGDVDELAAQHAGDASQSRTVSFPRPAGVSGHVQAQFLISFEPGPRVAEVRFLDGDTALRAAAPAVQAARYEVPFPLHESTRLVREAMVSCDSVAADRAQPPECVLVLVPPANATLPKP